MEIDTQILNVPVSSLKPDPNQPRKTFPAEVLENMAGTIKTHGTINPIEVDEKNVIITGELRWRAAGKAGVKTVPIKKIRGLAPDERLERQLIENYHQTDLNEEEGYAAIYKLFKTYEKRGKSKRHLADNLGISEITVERAIDTNVFMKKEHVKGVSVTAVTRTMGLPTEDRLKLIQSVKKGKYSARELENITPIIRQAPRTIKEKIIKREIEPDQARQMVEVYHEAPEPLRQAIVEEKVKLEDAKSAVALYEELKKEGVQVSNDRIKAHVEELSRETRVEEAEAKLRRQSYKEALAGRKQAIDLQIVDRGTMFVQEVKDVAWRVKGWGVPNMMAIGASRWKEAQKYFREIRDHMDFLLAKSPR